MCATEHINSNKCSGKRGDGARTRKKGGEGGVRVRVRVKVAADRLELGRGRTAVTSVDDDHTSAPL